METFGFRDGNVYDLLESRHTRFRQDINHNLQMHSSLIRRLSLEYELEGHNGCVNSVAWNSSGSLLISGSDDTQINIWSYPGQQLLHSIESGHSANIFCTKFMHETSDELVASGAGDAEVRLFNLSRVSGTRLNDNAIAPSALYQCHTKRVKKLAVEVGNPHVIWSASEDGTLRQHDLREGSSCPPAGSSHQECRNILLDLRCGAKSSLADPPKQTLSLKSCDISSTKPHYLIVGGSDAFARLYDRRMLPSLSSSQRKRSPPQCVNYFCPMHLSERGHSSLLLTHVTFSPNGEEVLLSYSGEHVYLMNLNHVGGSFIEYSSGDFSKIMNFSPMLNGAELHHHDSNAYINEFSKKNKVPELDKCKTLVQIAQKCLEEDTNYLCGIEACNEILDGSGYDIVTLMKHDLLCTRAALLLKRKWKNDCYMAIRDCYNAWRIDSSSFRAHSYMSEALSQMGKNKEALDFAIAAQLLNPSDSEVGERVNNLEADLATAEVEKSSKTKDGAARSDTRSGRILTLSDILYRSDANSDASFDGPISEREDSEYDDEVELDFETSISGYDTDNVDANIVHGSINLRMHRRGRGDSSRDSGGASGSCGSLPSSSQSEKTIYQPEFAVDMKMRYVGHCNIGTDIKQASFLGQRGEYVASGSDDGRWFIWEKRTGRLVKMLRGDGAVVNCVQCHPFDGAVATSGIDNTIKMWTPTAPFPSIVAGGAAGPETADVMPVIEDNQRKLLRNREALLPFEIIERLRMHEFGEGSLHPFECAQS